MSKKELVEQCAKALWDNEQKNTFLWYFSNPLMYGNEFEGKSVPWEHLLTKNVIPSVAEDYRIKARIVLEVVELKLGHVI